MEKDGKESERGKEMMATRERKERSERERERKRGSNCVGRKEEEEESRMSTFKPTHTLSHGLLYCGG